MVTHQSKQQKQTVSRVMHEFKHGELTINGNGPKVKDPKQAVAIALHEAGATNQESPQKNKTNLRRTKTKERQGETAEAAKEGKAAQDRTMKSATARKTPARKTERTRDELYAEAKRHNIPGRSKMSKAQLAKAIHA